MNYHIWRFVFFANLIKFNCSNHVFFFFCSILIFNYFQAAIEEDKEPYSSAHSQTRELERFDVGIASPRCSDIGIDLEWFNEAELDSEGNPVNQNDDNYKAHKGFSQFSNKDEWVGLNENDYTTIMPSRISRENIEKAEIAAQEIRNDRREHINGLRNKMVPAQAQKQEEPELQSQSQSQSHKVLCRSWCFYVVFFSFRVVVIIVYFGIVCFVFVFFYEPNAVPT